MHKTTTIPITSQAGTLSHSLPECDGCYTCAQNEFLDTGSTGALALFLEYLPNPRPVTQKEPKKKGISRYTLLRMAQNLSSAGDRIKLCQSPILAFGGQSQHVEIRRSVSSGRHSFGHLMNCRNVWQCPVCAARTAQKRGEDVKQAMEQHRRAGGVCDMHTYTFSHHYGDDLKQIERKMQLALRRLKSGRWFQQWRHNIIGTINGKEVTHGQNGFHPHVHEVLFLRRSWTDEEQAQWTNKWIEVLALEGLEGSADYAFNCRRNIKPTDYISKTGDMTLWGGDKELLATHAKSGDGLNQWEILGLSDNPYYADLWRTYVSVYRGRRRLTWSRGLKEKFGIGDEQQDAPATVEGILTKEEFMEIHTRNDETAFLELVDDLGFNLAKFTYFNIRHDLTIRKELRILRE